MKILPYSESRTGLPSSAAMRLAYDLARLYSAVDRPVVFVGPIGSGKTLLAHYLHTCSGRPGEFVALSAGEVSESLYHDSLFGHLPGAFTGAASRRKGAFERAANGTVFFDDLAYLPRVAQTAVLRVLENRVFSPIGATRDLPVTCRELYATTTPLFELVDQGLLLPDFESRLGELVIRLPALTERTEDILPIAHDVAVRFLREHGHAAREVRISTSAADLLVEYHWPKNVRELKHVIERAVVHAGMERHPVEIQPSNLSARFHDSRRSEVDGARPGGSLSRELVQLVLRETAGNQSEAARRLGVHRNTIARYTRVVG